MSRSEDSVGATDGPTDGAAEPEADTTAVLQARLELLEADNRRLRREYARARRVSYRRTAAGLALVGLGAVLGGVVLPAAREVLLVLGAIGLFGAVLTYYLTPERVVAAATGERIYAAAAETLAALSEQLGLADKHVYVPLDGQPPVRLFVPVHEQYTRPDAAALRGPLVVTAEETSRGLAVVPAGAYLFAEFERTLSGPFGEGLDRAVAQLTDGLVEGFELADRVESDLDVADGRLTVAIDGSVYGGGRFENPLASFLAVGLTQALETPVTTTVQAEATAGALTVTCRWDAETAGSEGTDG